MDNWDEIRTAFQVARLGTVSGAADVLGVHHATVIRHIDALEGRLGVKLFQPIFKTHGGVVLLGRGSTVRVEVLSYAVAGRLRQDLAVTLQEIVLLFCFLLVFQKEQGLLQYEYRFGPIRDPIFY